MKDSPQLAEMQQSLYIVAFLRRERSLRVINDRKLVAGDAVGWSTFCAWKPKTMVKRREPNVRCRIPAPCARLRGLNGEPCGLVQTDAFEAAWTEEGGRRRNHHPLFLLQPSAAITRHKLALFSGALLSVSCDDSSSR